MSHNGTADPMALATSLTRLSREMASGLEEGGGELLQRVTPVTAELLRWWFGQEACRGREANFHRGQRQAIVNVILAHEVLDSPDLPDLYARLNADTRAHRQHLAALERDGPGHPKYCIKMATATGKTWVLQALLIWQMLNRTAASDEGRDDPRHSRHFLIVTPGLIVHERLLRALLGERRADGSRDFATSDTVRLADLLVPPDHRMRVNQFVRGNVCSRHDIARRTTGNGLIAVTNWQLLGEAPDGLEAERAVDASGADGRDIAPETLARRLLPLVPGRAVGNRLDVLDRQHERGRLLAMLAALPDLVVFNDEAHHIHWLENPQGNLRQRWRKSLTGLASDKGRRFIQIDLSATPYEQRSGSGHRARSYFPHIVADFDLGNAVGQGLVKSLVLERRAELNALPLAFKAERDGNGNIALAPGQQVMLRLGLRRLRQLEEEFAAIEPGRRPRMLVVCEDTAVAPLVAGFLHDEGLDADDVLTVDSGRKAELDEDQWASLQQRLFDIDRQARPRVIVSVLMLREGFDVDSICVIVPLRSSRAPILLEQIIGRGLRLMWREPEFASLKHDNRERIARGEPPGSLIDVLTIVEHPAFQGFYDGLMAQGLVGESGVEESGSTGDLLTAALRADFHRYDFAMPFVASEGQTIVEHRPVDLNAIPALDATTRERLWALLERNEDTASPELVSADPTSPELHHSALFADYMIDGAMTPVGGYNELLSRLTRRIGQGLDAPLPAADRTAAHLPLPYLQWEIDVLAAGLDAYVRARLFDRPFDPLHRAGWRVLMLKPVIDHLIDAFATALVQSRCQRVVTAAHVRHRRLSEAPRLIVRGSASMPVSKCIYPRLPCPTRSLGIERDLMDWAEADASIEAFCRVDRQRHDFMRMRYLRDDGLAAIHFPDFMFRTAAGIHVVEIRQAQSPSPGDRQRQLRAAAARFERINRLPADDRSHRVWRYLSLDRKLFRDWQCHGGPLAELLESLPPA